jgi:bacterioferritin
MPDLNLAGTCSPAKEPKTSKTSEESSRLCPKVALQTLRASENKSTLKRSVGAAMKGNPKVIKELNDALREELTAINQYFLHAEMCENWGYNKLAGYIKKQSIGEMKHAEVLIERILFLDGTPSMEPLKLTVGGNVQHMIESDLELELGAVKQYNAAVQIATQEKDNGSRDLLVKLLKDEEDHVDWLEAQLHQIKEVGYERYLSLQAGSSEEK